MELETHGAPARGLRTYIHRVAEALNLGTAGYCIEPDPPVSAYIPLDDRLPGFPNHDLALTWDEENGWAAAIESHSPHQLIALSYLGDEVLPAPSTVAQFVAEVVTEQLPGQPLPPALRTHTDKDDLPERLARYAKIGRGTRLGEVSAGDLGERGEKRRREVLG
jgi:hypothetical protein